MSNHIVTLDRLTFTDVHAYPAGTILHVKEVLIYRGRPECALVALSLQGSAYYSVSYHAGWASWMFCKEYSAQKASSHYPGRLDEALQSFEERVGQSLPLIKVTHVGVGIYPAQAPDALENPWRLEPGKFYACTDPVKGRREFVVDGANNQLRLSFITSDEVSEPFDPAIVLSKDDWLSLTPLTP